MKKRGKYGQWRITGAKKCLRCLQTKPISEFYWKTKGKCLFSYCKPCKLAENEARKHSYSREQRATWQRHAMLRGKWGMEPEEYDKKLSGQGCGCAICGGTNAGRRLAVDHCHATGKIRGLLCSGCNHALGHMKDSLPRLQKAMEYLRKYGATWS